MYVLIEHIGSPSSRPLAPSVASRSSLNTGDSDNMAEAELVVVAITDHELDPDGVPISWETHWAEGSTTREPRESFVDVENGSVVRVNQVWLDYMNDHNLPTGLPEDEERPSPPKTIPELPTTFNPPHQLRKRKRGREPPSS